MAKIKTLMSFGVILTSTTLSAQFIPATTPGSTNNSAVPERAIILSGGKNGVNREVMAVLYDTNGLHFQDPTAPRFLLIDREGTTVFGIGGYIKGIGYVDFDGAIDNDGFVTNKIAVPSDPAFRNQIGASATHTNIFMQLVTNTKWGVLTAYAQGNFSDPHYGFKLDQAYIRLHNVTAGLTRSTFEDALAGTPTVDYEGPSGAVSIKNIMLQYKLNFANNFTVALSAEIPKAEYTVNSSNQEIGQRFPDIPAYIQYQWDGSKSHIRASGLFRNLSYRNLTSGKNHFKQGWGAQLSGAIMCSPLATVHYQAVYGKGIANYVNDLENSGYDLIHNGTDGSMEAPGVLGIVGGLRFNITKDLFVSSSYSLCRLYNQEQLGPNAYRRANYAVVNAFYTPIPDLQLGLEYIHGRRTNMNGEHGTANRIEAMIKYSF